MLRRSIHSLSPSHPSHPSKKADVVIIGAGVIGCACALELARNKDFTSSFPNGAPKILVVDSNPKAGMGTTSWSSGIIRTFYSTKPSVRLSLECIKIWENWRDYLELPENSYPKTQLCTIRKTKGWFCKSPAHNEFIDKFESAAEEYNIPRYNLDLEETKKIAQKNGWDISKSYKPRSMEDDDFGEVDTTASITGSLVVPDTYYVSDPGTATVNIQDSCMKPVHKNMISFMFGKKVTKINRVKSSKKNDVAVSSVTLANGDVIESPRIINCAGPYSSAVNKLVFSETDDGCGPLVKTDATLTTRPLRIEGNILEAPPGLNPLSEDGIISFDLETGFYVRPESKNRIVVGGLEIKEDPLEYIDIENLHKTESGGGEDKPGDQAMLWAYRYALRVPSARIPVHPKGFVSSYDVTEDWSPICDKSNVDGYYQVIGTSGNCFKTAPLLAQMMSKIIVETENGDGSDSNKSSSYLHLPLGGESGSKLPLDTYNRKRSTFNIFGGVIG